MSCRHLLWFFAVLTADNQYGNPNRKKSTCTMGCCGHLDRRSLRPPDQLSHVNINARHNAVTPKQAPSKTVANRASKHKARNLRMCVYVQCAILKVRNRVRIRRPRSARTYTSAQPTASLPGSVRTTSESCFGMKRKKKKWAETTRKYEKAVRTGTRVVLQHNLTPKVQQLCTTCTITDNRHYDHVRTYVRTYSSSTRTRT